MTLPTWRDLVCDAKSRGNIKEQVPDNELGVAERRRKVAMLLLDLNVSCSQSEQNKAR